MARGFPRSGTLVGVLGSMLSGCGFGSDFPPLAEFDWAPEAGSIYDMSWRKGAPDTLEDSDLKHFIVTARLASPAKTKARAVFQVMAGTLPIGTIEATFAAGSRSPTTVYAKSAGDDYTPAGTQDVFGGRFWLGCTTVKGNVRGNADHRTAPSTDVYLRVGSDHARQTPKHRVTCRR